MRRVAVLRFLQCLCQAKRVIMRLILRLILRLVLRSRVKAMAGTCTTSKSSIRPPVTLQFTLEVRGIGLLPNDLSLLATDLSSLLVAGKLDPVPPAVRRRCTVRVSHGGLCLFCSSKVDKAEALSCARLVKMSRDHWLTDSLHIKAFEQVLHLGIDERLAGNGGQPAYEQPSAFLDRFGPVVARVVPCVSVEDEGFGIRWLRWFKVEGLPPAFLRASFDMATPGAVAFA